MNLRPAQQVHRIGHTSRTRDETAVPACTVTSAGPAVQRHHVGQVDVPAHDEVGAGGGPALQCSGVPSQPIRHIVAARHRHGLVHHHHAQLLALATARVRATRSI